MQIKFLFFALFSLSVIFQSRADQLMALTAEQLSAAASYLNSEEFILLWCGCCDEDPIRVVEIQELYWEETEFLDEAGNPLYTLMLNGIDQNGNEISGEPLDLAYVHVIVENMAYCLGVQLGFECDPCVEPFALD
jgi:hypothetical protein